MLFILFLFIVYAVFILWLSQGIKNVDVTNNQAESNLYISVVIAIKNEANNLPALLQALTNQTISKDKFEIIVVNDNSVDDSINILNAYKSKIKNLKVIKSCKKLNGWDCKMYALSKGIEVSKGDIILHTDGDCLPGNHWIEKFYEKFCNPKVGIVFSRTPLNGNTFLEKIIQLESLAQDIFGAMAIGHNLFYTCNGRSLGYRKKYYDDVGGYDKISKVIGGDDDLLIHKIISNKHCETNYIMTESASVYSKCPPNPRALIDQRLRYASKVLSLYKFSFVSNEIKIVMPFLFAINFIVFFSLMALSYRPDIYLFIFITIKMIADYILIYFFTSITKDKIHLMQFLVLSFLHPFYIVIFPLVSPFIKLRWKNN